jgi:G protein beta subunit-like protein
MSYDIVLVSSGYDMIIRFWSDFNSGTNCKYQIEHKDNAINALEMTPSKDKVAFASGNSIKFIDLHKLGPVPILSIDSHEGLLSTILFPQMLKDIVITGGEDCSVRVSDMRVGKVVKSFFHTNYVNSIAIGNSNKDIIAADENGTIKIWDMDKGEVRTEYNSNIEEEGLAFRSISLAEKEGFLVGAKSNGNVCIFDYNNNNEGQNLSKPKVFEAHKNYITKCLLSPENNMLATCSADSEIRLWERKNLVDEDGNIQTDNMGKPLLSTDFDLKTRFIGHKKWVWDCDFTLDSNYLLSCSSDKTIKIWNIATGKVYSTFNNPKGVNNIALSD